MSAPEEVRVWGPGAQRAACDDGQMVASTHSPQRGRRAMQTARPWEMSRWERRVHCARGNALHQVPLDLDGVDLAGQAEEPGEASDVGIDHHPFVDVEGVAEHHVGRLAADAGEGVECRHRSRDLAVVVRHQRLGHRDQVPRLVTEEAGGPDDPFDIAVPRGRERRRRGIGAEEFGGDQVDPAHRCIGPRGSWRQGVGRVAMIQGAVGVG